jgi:electron transfer flavoprotein beta subunit
MAPLRIFVCVKPVPDPRYWDRIALNPDTGTLRRVGIPSVINPLDKHAVEAGLQAKAGASAGGEVTILSMAPPDALGTLRQALAMGADRALLLTDRAFAGADTLATSYVLATAIEKLGGADLILCGAHTVDGSTGQVGPQVAEFLGITQVTNVSRIGTVDDNQVRVEARMGRHRLTIAAELPVLLTVSKEVNSPRYVSLAGLLDAEEKEVLQWAADDLGADRSRIGAAGSPTQLESLFVVETGRRGEILPGTPAESAKLLVEKLRAAGVL